MKRLYTEFDTKRKNEISSRRELRRKNTLKSRKKKKVIGSNDRYYNNVITNSPIVAPSDFRLLENTEKCLNFFGEIRNAQNLSIMKNRRFVAISLRKVKQVDYSTISVLIAISEDFTFQRIAFRGDSPADETVNQYFIDSGFFEHLFDSNGKLFPKSTKSDKLSFEKGSQLFDIKDNRRISEIIKKINHHLTGKYSHNPRLRTVLLEIFANSIEWSQTNNKQWLLGVKYDDDSVIITVTDVGKGILRTLNKKWGRKFFDKAQLKSNKDILTGAFDKKYGSSSQKVNRNKGLPSIKSSYQDGVISELKVLTNNVIIHFDNPLMSRTFPRGTSWFKGTFYRCVVKKS
ncbi:MAG TPA: hypothetical protein DCE78_09955 [Bacteroidetes bacterium]|nr:hypothetical protein [Bacteroidota bacterium]